MPALAALGWTAFRFAIVSLVAWFGVEWVIANLPNDTPEQVAHCIRQSTSALQITGGEALKEIVDACEKVHGLNK